MTKGPKGPISVERRKTLNNPNSTPQPILLPPPIKQQSTISPTSRLQINPRGNSYRAQLTCGFRCRRSRANGPSPPRRVCRRPAQLPRRPNQAEELRPVFHENTIRDPECPQIAAASKRFVVWGGQRILANWFFIKRGTKLSGTTLESFHPATQNSCEKKKIPGFAGRLPSKFSHVGRFRSLERVPLSDGTDNSQVHLNGYRFPAVCDLRPTWRFEAAHCSCANPHRRSDLF